MLNQFPAFIDRRMAGQEYVGQQASKFTKLGLQKLTDIHSTLIPILEIEPNGDINRSMYSVPLQFSFYWSPVSTIWI